MSFITPRVVLLGLSCLLSAGCTDRIFNDEFILLHARHQASPAVNAGLLISAAANDRNQDGNGDVQRGVIAATLVRGT